jgi:hypothetical protein
MERQILKFISELLHNEGLRSVVLVIIGFLLAELKDYFAIRRERKEAVSAALSDLLEVRHRFVGLELLVDELSSLGETPEHVKSQLRINLDSLFPNWQELHDRYDKSVTTLARLDPLLSFQLRSKDFIGPTMRNLHSVMARDSQTATLLALPIKKGLVDKAELALNESALKLARGRSLLCWYRTRRLLKKAKELSSEGKEAWEPIKAILKSQIEARTGQAAPTSPTSTP